jgi:hypothetical protein
MIALDKLSITVDNNAMPINKITQWLEPGTAGYNK